jgi:hypothetical protein
MMPAAVDFGRVAQRTIPARPSVVTAADAPALPNFEINQPLRAPRFPPRKPKLVVPLFGIEAPAWREQP